MNREKHLNKADRKRKTFLNGSATHSSDHNYAVDRYEQRTPMGDVNNTEMKTSPRCHHSRPDVSSYYGCPSTRLNSVRQNAEADDVSDRDLLPFCREADFCSSEFYQGRIVSNNSGLQRSQKFSNGKKKKEKIYSHGLDRTISSSAVVPVSQEAGAAGFVDMRMRSDHCTGRQGYIGMWYSQPNTSRDEPFSNEDHLLAAAPIAASEKVSSHESDRFYTQFDCKD